jgi:hypothetical protein
MSLSLLVARSLAFLWAGFWTFFTLASGLPSAPLQVKLCVVPLLALAWASIFLTRRFPRMGGTLLLGEGLGLLAILYTFLQRSPNHQYSSFLLVTMVLPALVAGVLYLLGNTPKKPIAIT